MLDRPIHLTILPLCQFARTIKFALTARTIKLFDGSVGVR
jgi:hypothetical protein